MAVCSVHLLFFLTFLQIIVIQSSQHPNSAIVFPPTNDVPKNTGLTNFDKAIKSVHYAAARVLDLSQDEQEKNWVVSPVSLSAIFGQLMLGARGDFHRILGEILSPGKNEEDNLPGLDLHKQLGILLRLLQDDVLTDYQLYIDSALFLHPDIKLRLAYKYALSDIYNVQVVKTNFSGNPLASMEKVNKWVEKTTSGRIPDILQQPPLETTASIYINTVYFKAPWKVPFDPLFTRPGFFRTSPTQTTLIDFMAGDLEVKLLEDEDCHCKLIGIPYESTNIYLYIFLPKEDPAGNHFRLKNLLQSLPLNKINEMIANAKPENVTLTIPKVSLTTSMSLRKPLVQAFKRRKHAPAYNNKIRGARDLLADDEDLGQFLSNAPLPLKIDAGSGLTFNMGSASDDFRFKIDDILHKVSVDISEGGTEAAAVTVSLTDYIGKPIIKVDRPYLFLIRHEFTTAHLFWGGIYNPSNLGV